MHDVLLSRGGLTASYLNYIQFSSKTGDHRQNPKPQELRNLELIIRAKNILLSTSRAREFEETFQAKKAVT